MSDKDNSNDKSTSSGTFDQIMKELVENDKKRVREEEDDDDSREPESKRQRVGYYYDSDYISGESPYETSDSVSDDGEESEIARINTKYSKRFDAIEDYKEKNELLSETVIQDAMNKVDSGQTLSREDYDTLKIANRLMDRDIYNDKSLAEEIILHENSTNITQKEIIDNHERIEEHKRKLSGYISRLNELNEENSRMSSDNDSSNSDNNYNNNPDVNNPDSSNLNSNNSDSKSLDSNNLSNLPGQKDDFGNNNNSNINNPSNSSGANNDGDDDGFDDFPPSFDFDDF